MTNINERINNLPPEKKIDKTVLEKENNEDVRIEPLSGQEVADNMENIFTQLSLNMKKKILGSNVILTLSGMKPNTEVSLTANKDQNLLEYKKDVEILNQNYSDKGINFKLYDKVEEKRSNKELYQSLMIESLRGYERITKTLKIPGLEIPVFNTESGFAGLGQWKRKLWESIDKANDQGKLPFRLTEKESDHLYAGIQFGYPSQAILDIVDPALQARKEEQVDSQIPYADMYSDAQPDFEFLPEHSNDQEIKEYIKKAGEILKDFYQSKWQQEN